MAVMRIGPIGVKRRILSLCIAVAGILIVFAGGVALNMTTHEPESEKRQAVVTFSVPTKPRKKEQQERPPQRRRAPRANQPALAPLPNLGGGLSSITVEMPDYTADSLNSVSESLLGDIDEDVVMTADTVDTLPQPQNAPNPPYPERAKQRDIEGKVIVSIQIGADGRVKNAKILEATPPGVFEDAVLQTVMQWTFTPAKYKDRSVEMWGNLTFPFNL